MVLRPAKTLPEQGAQLALAVETTPARRIASQVDVYSLWPTSTRFGKVGVDRYFGTHYDVDITNLRTTNYSKIIGDNSKTMVRMQDGRKVLIHNSKTRTTVGPKGLISSIIGAGLIDAAFQLYNDWAQGLCLSPNQYFWRSYVALLFGLGVGVVGAVTVIGLVAFGVPALGAGLIGFGVSAGVGYGLDYFEIRPNVINDVSDAAGRW